MRYTAEKIGEIVAARYGAECVYLFGSCARGDADADSDIDLRIDNGTIRDLQIGGLAADL
ncbi:nucleotidyltransferase family protein [Ruthenibacterium lactatiformans]|uniref:nucleotidyltransferase family protein n=1 Tax=Ruthenibacterium lactatiformans TaxID=1550024 RepID=UPI001FAA0431|nr:nucleotidyltransferase domain-containing protein [Ruthenibacterium lactatiformans]